MKHPTVQYLNGLLRSSLALWALPLAAQDAGNPALPALMAEDREVSLALSAGPPAVSARATVYLLRRGGYVKVRTGSNGFTCLVERDRADTLEPVCYDEEGSAALLPPSLRKAELRESGRTPDEINREIAEGYRTGRYHAPRRPGIAYMLAREQKVFDPESGKVAPYVPHLMFYGPYLRNTDLGYPAGTNGAGEGGPFIIGEGEPGALIIVPVGMDSFHH